MGRYGKGLIPTNPTRRVNLFNKVIFYPLEPPCVYIDVYPTDHILLRLLSSTRTMPFAAAIPSYTSSEGIIATLFYFSWIFSYNKQYWTTYLAL